MVFERINPKRTFTSGRCAACGKQIALGDGEMRLYDEHYHYDCTFYRSRASRNGDGPGPNGRP